MYLETPQKPSFISYSAETQMKM